VFYVLSALAITAVLAILYAVVRSWLKRQPWTAKFFAAIEPYELALFKKSETILVGRLLWVGGILVTFYDSIAIFASGLDLTPVTTRAFDFLGVPTDMRGVATTAFITAIGYLINWLRKRTTKPIEVVAVAEKDLTQETRHALLAAEVFKDEAVAAVQQAKAG
jgi:hypothetical protein